MADSKNLKSIIDEQLNNFCVTEELKRKTLEKCKKSSYSSKGSLTKKLNIAIAAVLIFIMFAGTYLMSLIRTTKDNKYVSKQDIKNENTSNIVESDIEDKVKDYTNEKHTEYAIKDKGKNKIAKEKSISGNKKPSLNARNEKTQDATIKSKKETKDVKIIAKDRHTSSLKKDDALVKENNDEVKDNSKDENISWDDKVKNVEKVWGGKIDFPAYVPEGYEVHDLIACNSMGNKSIRIIYKNEDSYFEVKQVKEASPAPASLVKVNDNNSKAQEKKEDKESTDLDATKNGIYYNVKGSVAKEILEKVIDSIN